MKKKDDAAQLAWMPLYTQDLLGSTRVQMLDDTQFRWYIELLCHLWVMPDCRLTFNKGVLRRLLKVARWSKKVDQVMALFEVTNDGFIYNERQRKEWLRQQEVYAKRRQGAELTNKQRWGTELTSESHSESQCDTQSESQSETQCESQGESQLRTQNSEEDTNVSSKEEFSPLNLNDERIRKITGYKGIPDTPKVEHHGHIHALNFTKEQLAESTEMGEYIWPITMLLMSFEREPSKRAFDYWTEMVFKSVAANRLNFLLQCIADMWSHYQPDAAIKDLVPPDNPAAVLNNQIRGAINAA